MLLHKHAQQHSTGRGAGQELRGWRSSEAAAAAAVHIPLQPRSVALSQGCTQPHTPPAAASELTAILQCLAVSFISPGGRRCNTFVSPNLLCGYSLKVPVVSVPTTTRAATQCCTENG